MTRTPHRRAVDHFIPPMLLVAGLAVLQLLNTLGLAGSDLAWGVVPRQLDHLSGIATFHLRHAGWGHWLANAVPLLVLPGLASLLAPRATRHAWWIIPVACGTFLWVFGRNAVHVGASGLVYGWFFFLVGLAAFHRSWASLVGLLLALALFGGLLWVFQGGGSVSWEGHLGGALAGVLAARLTKPGKQAQAEAKPTT